MLSRRGLLMGVGATLAAFAQPAARAQDATYPKITEAMQHQVDFLFTQKHDDNWDTGAKWSNWLYTPSAETSLVLYALLNASKNLNDPRLNARSPELAPVIKYLVNARPITTYGASLQACALSLIPKVAQPPLYAQGLRHDESFLEHGIRPDGGFAYAIDGQGANYPTDGSNTQYATLGMWALADSGIPVPGAFWTIQDHHWKGWQNPDGGWPYHAHEDSRLAMTSAGLASSYITDEFSSTGPPVLESRPNKGLANAYVWLAKNFKPAMQAQDTDVYALYACERAGLASGCKFFGTNNWYQQGAQRLLSLQQPDGSTGAQCYGATRTVNTALALLFLSRGINPVAFNKLQYGRDDTSRWNARPLDDANLTHWISRQLETQINWQFVNLQVNADQWADAPILLITGSEDPHFSPDDEAKLKTFIEAGGTLFSSADGNSAAFTAAVKNTAARLFPHAEPMRTLEPSHPLFATTFKIAPGGPAGNVMATSNGVRELWVHSPSDFGAMWQSKTTAAADAWQFPANLYAYVTGKSAARRGTDNENAPAVVIRTLNVARLSFGDGSDPEPGAWAHFAAVAAATFETNIRTKPVDIEQLAAGQTPIAHLSGTKAFKLSPAQLDRLRTFIDAGGTLLIDAAGSSVSFTDSARDNLKALYPDAPLEDLDPDSAPLRGQFPDGQPITRAHYRPATFAKGNGSRDVRLLGLKHKNRYAVFFSQDDLVSGLLGLQTYGLEGYTPESAAQVVRNLLLYAAQTGGAAATN